MKTNKHFLIPALVMIAGLLTMAPLKMMAAPIDKIYAGYDYNINGGATQNWPANGTINLFNGDVMTILATASQPNVVTTINVASEAIVTINSSGSTYNNLCIYINPWAKLKINNLNLSYTADFNNVIIVRENASLTTTGICAVNSSGSAAYMDSPATITVPSGSSLTLVSTAQDAVSIPGTANFNVDGTLTVNYPDYSGLSALNQSISSVIINKSGSGEMHIQGGGHSIVCGTLNVNAGTIRTSSSNLVGVYALNAINVATGAILYATGTAGIECNVGDLNVFCAGTIIATGSYRGVATPDQNMIITGAGSFSATAVSSGSKGMECKTLSITNTNVSITGGSEGFSTALFQTSSVLANVTVNGGSLSLMGVPAFYSNAAGSGFTLSPGSSVSMKNNNGVKESHPFNMSAAGAGVWNLTNMSTADPLTNTTITAQITNPSSIGTIKLAAAGGDYTINSGATQNWPAGGSIPLSDGEVMTILATAHQPNVATTIHLGMNANVTINGNGSMINNLKIRESVDDTQNHTITINNLQISSPTSTNGYDQIMGILNLTGSNVINGSVSGINSQSNHTLSIAGNGTLAVSGGTAGAINAYYLNIQGSANVTANNIGNGEAVNLESALNIDNGASLTATSSNGPGIWGAALVITNNGSLTVTGGGIWPGIDLTASLAVKMGVNAVIKQTNGTMYTDYSYTMIPASGYQWQLSGNATLDVGYTSASSPAKITIPVNATGTIKLVSPSGAPTITTTSLPNGTVGTAYSQTLTASGKTPITWSISGETLPAGLMLNGTTGEISGNPTKAGIANFTVKASNGVSPDAIQPLSITIDPKPATSGAPTITTTSLPNGWVGTAYSQTLAASGNTPITWSIDDGFLPAGLTITPNTGKISGTPTSTGTSNFTVKASNGALPDAVKDFLITIYPAATVTGVTVSPATISVQKGKTQQFTATVTGTNSPAQTVKWSVSGQIDDGTAISNAGLLTVAAGETAASLTVTATSTMDNTKSGTATVTVINTNTGIDAPQVDHLRAWTENGKLHLSGLTAGKQWSVYNIAGMLVHRAIAAGSEAETALPARGIYIVRSDGRELKVKS